MAMFNIDCNDCSRKSVCKIYKNISNIIRDMKDCCDNLHVRISCIDQLFAGTRNYASGYSRSIKFEPPKDFKFKCCVECKSSKYCVYCDDADDSHKLEFQSFLDSVHGLSNTDTLKVNVACVAFDDHNINE